MIRLAIDAFLSALDMMVESPNSRFFICRFTVARLCNTQSKYLQKLEQSH